MAGTTTYIATDPNGTEHTRASRTMAYTHALLVSDDDARTWYARSWHTSERTANDALSSNGSYSPSGIRRLVEVTEKPKGRQPKAKLTPLSAVGSTGDAILDAAVAAAADDATTEGEETPQQRRNRKARERRAAKKQATGEVVATVTPEPTVEQEAEVRVVSFADDWDAAPVGARPVEDDVPAADDGQEVADLESQPEEPEADDTTTVEPVEEGQADDTESQPAEPSASEDDQPEVVEVEDQPEPETADTDEAISAALEVTPEQIEEAKAQVVKGERCPGYKMAVPDNGKRRAECPVCGHSVKRYAKSGLLGSHRA
ncbi:hypothetical protein SEA_BIPPER_43 [Mycobacterium phage Bipper]|uniref:Uncharacterized protein n=1 Tax=Mycobacterium phage Bipper TaxID=1805457 RepID=A0A142F2H1_9CAUD|nr:hypothetical protein KCH39_gp134 [Mycobacterium phage Bipper]AMQ66978.1 hypothetical protein SEA_BIPPER_43 [Mycobacterium phage Bipper]